MAQQAIDPSARAFILEMIRKLRSPSSAHRGVHVKEIEVLFRQKFGDTLSKTLDAMVKSQEVIAIHWIQGDPSETWRRHYSPIDAQIVGAFPDPNYPETKNPRLYIPGELPRVVMKFAHRAPTLEIREAINQRKKQAKETNKKNFEQGFGATRLHAV